jgi:hypothetical protein
MKRFAPRLTYANVMATIAVFIALGGASYAAIKLPKNSVGSSQIKKNAITTAKLKKEAVTGAKIKIGSLGTVPSAKYADTAGSAANAGSAASAANAAHAIEADSVGGQRVEKLFWSEPEGTAKQTVFSGSGLTISASCSSSSKIAVTASSTEANAEFDVFGYSEGSPFDLSEASFGEALSMVDGAGQHEGSGTFVYATSNGTLITGSYGFDYPNSFNGIPNCSLFGTMIVS